MLCHDLLHPSIAAVAAASEHFYAAAAAAEALSQAFRMAG